MRIKTILVAFFSIGVGVAANAQVGIGNPTPDSTSVLDLTNPNNRGLVLPRAANTAAMSNEIDGMTYFLNDNIFYKTSIGYNGISPWKFRFNGNITNDVYYNLGGKIGIGNADVTQTPEAPLQIETVDSVNLIDNGSIMIGKSTDKNIVVNANEVQSRSAGSGSRLKINEDGGNVTFGSAVTKSDVQVSGNVQQLNVNTGNYYDVMPVGTVLMWFADTASIPEGFALCDGGSYPRMDGLGNINTPNLSGRFVVGFGNNGVADYAAGQTGGQDSVALTVTELASHNHNITHKHTISDPGHKHNFTVYDSGSGMQVPTHDDDNSDTETASTHNAKTNITINNFSGNSQNTGDGTPHENRPTFTALVYIMKL